MTALLLAAALAQPPAPPAASPDAAIIIAARTVWMTEDVEVLRRLLNRTLGLPNDPNTQAAPAATWLRQAQPYTTPGTYTLDVQANALSYLAYAGAIRAADPFDGIYLKGHGVVYTLRVKPGEQYALGEAKRGAGLAATCTLCHVGVPVSHGQLEPESPAAAASEWEQTRNDLRGVKSPPAPAPAAVCKPGSLTEAVIGVLAKNGKHLRALAAGESVTVVVTLDGVYGPARAAAAAAPATPLPDYVPGAFQRADKNRDGRITPTEAGEKLSSDFVTWDANKDGSIDLDEYGKYMTARINNSPFGSTSRTTDGGFTLFSADEAKLLVMADLHLKNNEAVKAVSELQAALHRYPDAEVKLPLTPAQLIACPTANEATASLADARRKLAQALVAIASDAKGLDAAKKALDTAAGTKVTFTDAAAPKAVPVPAKLVLTAKKVDLDRAEKLSPAEVRKLFAVEAVGFPPADKAKK